ncbi:hypothetical protein CSB20_08140 [bacterium DOLZORAL124_64_63]|nr:MAG: hypothetical protein CSB20_08140 [bacterium DOLZORAL124_64_63]
MRVRTLLLALSCLSALFLRALPAAAHLAPILIDGRFDEWQAVPTLAMDPAGDGASSGIDFQSVQVANDQDYLFFSFDVTGEIQLDADQQLRLYLDTDLDSGTGIPFHGIGADLCWEFGWREGTFRTGGISYDLNHADVGLMAGPTVSNDRFEIALARDAVPAAGQALFPGGTVRFILRDATGGGDVFPDSGSLSYTFSAGAIATESIDLARDDPAHLRLATYNIENDGLFAGGAREAALERLFQAMDADVFIISEVWGHSAAAVRAKVAQFLPGAWHAVTRDGGNVIVSRYPILQAWAVLAGHRITAALLDLGADRETDLLVIANHWRSGNADEQRQLEADAVVAFLRDARSPGGVITLPEGTPVILGGDFNLVGWRQQLDTVMTGDIVNEGQFGGDAAPDWDGTPLALPVTRHPDARAAYTWRSDWSSYYPGLLDFVFYSDSALDLRNHYILDTRTMTALSLANAGLWAQDTPLGSDHAPRVADFHLISAPSPVPGAAPARVATLLPNHPNPFNPATTLRFELAAAARCRLEVLDVRGARIRELTAGEYPAGVSHVVWDGRDDAGRGVASGVYRARLVVDTPFGPEVWSRPMLLLQ